MKQTNKASGQKSTHKRRAPNISRPGYAATCAERLSRGRGGMQKSGPGRRNGLGWRLPGMPSLPTTDILLWQGLNNPIWVWRNLCFMHSYMRNQLAKRKRKRCSCCSCHSRFAVFAAKCEPTPSSCGVWRCGVKNPFQWKLNYSIMHKLSARMVYAFNWICGRFNELEFNNFPQLIHLPERERSASLLRRRWSGLQGSWRMMETPQTNRHGTQTLWVNNTFTSELHECCERTEPCGGTGKTNRWHAIMVL